MANKIKRTPWLEYDDELNAYRPKGGIDLVCAQGLRRVLRAIGASELRPKRLRVHFQESDKGETKFWWNMGCGASISCPGYLGAVFYELVDLLAPAAFHPVGQVVRGHLWLEWEVE